MSIKNARFLHEKIIVFGKWTERPGPVSGRNRTACPERKKAGRIRAPGLLPLYIFFFIALQLKEEFTRNHFA